AGNLPGSVTASFTNDNLPGATSATLTLVTGSGIATPNQTSIRITGSSGAISQVIDIPLILVPRLSINQSINTSLAASDFHSRNRSGALTDIYQLALTSATSVTIDMRSTAFDPYLYLEASDGTI